MGYRSPELHSSALSPAEYRLYPSYVGSLLEEDSQRNQSGSRGRDEARPIAVGKVAWWISERMGVERKSIMQILAKFPSYPSSTLSIGEIYALFRLISHAKQRGDHPLEDDLAFVQTLPLRTNGTQSTSGSTVSKASRSPPPVPDRNGHKSHDKPSRSKRDTATGPSQLPPSQNLTVNTVNSSLRLFRDAKPSPSTPLLNPFRQTDKAVSSLRTSSETVGDTNGSNASSESSVTRTQGQGSEASQNNNPFRKRLSLSSTTTRQGDAQHVDPSTKLTLVPSLPPLPEIMSMRPSHLPASYSITPASPATTDRNLLESNLARPGLAPRSHPQHLTFSSSTKSAAPSGPSDSSSSSSDETQSAYEKRLKAAKHRYEQKKVAQAPPISPVAELQVVRRSGSTQKSHTNGGQNNNHAALEAPANGLYVACAPPSRI